MFDIINRLLWLVASCLIVISGIYFTFRLRGIQISFKNIYKAIKKTKGQNSFQGLFLSLAAKIGVGSIAGIALAIYIGGIGTIFWIWIASILSAPNAYVEGFLSVCYKNDDTQGGPSYYIEKGLKKKHLAKIYSLLIILAYIVGFSPIQSNTIVVMATHIFSIDKIYITLILTFLIFIVVLFGIKMICNVSNIIVPLMGILYILLGTYIVINKFDVIPSIFMCVFKEAFNVKSCGIGIITSIIIGIQRGIFASEAGVGCGGIAAASVKNGNPHIQGIIQIICVYFSNFIICTISAVLLLTSNYKDFTFENLNGIELIQYALNYHLGNFGEYVLLIIVFFFAFSTILTGYYFGETSINFLLKEFSKKYIFLFKLGFIFLVCYGCIAKSNVLWDIVDIFVALMSIINIYAIIKLRNEVVNNDR